MADLLQARMASLSGAELTSFNVAAVAEALDSVAQLRAQNIGGEVVEVRTGEYKSWDAEVFRVDKHVEDGYIARIEERGRPVVLLSEEVERIEINADRGEPEAYVVSDPFDGSFLFKRDIPDFWYSSLAFFGSDGTPLSCAVGDAVHKTIVFADDSGVYVAKPEHDQLVVQYALDAQYRETRGDHNITELGKASIESYAMKPKKFLLPLVDKYRKVMEPFKFFLPNGGPYGFADVAEGKIDCYFAVQQPFVEIFSGIFIAQRAGTVVTDFQGNPVEFEDNIHGTYDVLVSANEKLHEQVLTLIAQCEQ